MQSQIIIFKAYKIGAEAGLSAWLSCVFSVHGSIKIAMVMIMIEGVCVRDSHQYQQFAKKIIEA